MLPSGPMVVLLDLENHSDHLTESSPLVWRLFKHVRPGELIPQAFLKGHTKKIVGMELALSGRLLASFESGPVAKLLLWDMVQGKRLVTLFPHAIQIIAVTFSSDNTLLATCGLDALRRTQIIVWDLQNLIKDKTMVFNHSQESPVGAIVAKQISDFHIAKLRFLPFDDTVFQASPTAPAATPHTFTSASYASEPGLVSCGRENIRFWRIRKGHLPGRPIKLNEFSRGYFFTDFDFHLEPPDEDLLRPMMPSIFVASNKGALFKIDPIKEVIICSYQLHSSAILSMHVQGGYAVTGGEDFKLRVWPMSFSDYLLEANHEGPVSTVHVAGGGRKLIVGTSAGTLGVLDVSNHSYNTVMRSHVNAISCCVARMPYCEEYVTLGKDGTIRVWDTQSCQQKFEFSSSLDEPRGVAYHTVENLHQITVGFESGYIRVFDLPTTAVMCERIQHSAPVVRLLYSPDGSRLFSAALDGCVVVYETQSYKAMKTIVVTTGDPTISSSLYVVETIFISLNNTGTLLATCGSNVSSLCIYSTANMHAVMRCGGSQQSNSQQQGMGNTSSTLARGSSSIMSSSKRGRSRNRSDSASVTSRGSSVGSRSSRGSSVGSRGSSGSRGSRASRSSRGSRRRRAKSASSVATPADKAEQLPPSGPHDSAPVSGIVFCEERPGGSLLVSTDKNIISLPLDMGTLMDRKNDVPKTGGWSIKPLSLGSAQLMVYDNSTGLTFVVYSLPPPIASSIGRTTTGISPLKLKAVVSDIESKTPRSGLALLHTSHKKTKKPIPRNRKKDEPVKKQVQISLQLTSPQIYVDPELDVKDSKVMDVCVMSAQGKVITVDCAGKINIWYTV